MLTFSTPFYPEILVASSVMAEGVDLHLNCRYMIDHDLCWNPSTLEQRSGRVDRIGAKAETAGQSIHIYIPFIAETQDEKMYRVVMDRERWFNVVMGEDYKVDARTTEKLANRIPFPPTSRHFTWVLCRTNERNCQGKLDDVPFVARRRTQIGHYDREQW